MHGILIFIAQTVATWLINRVLGWLADRHSKRHPHPDPKKTSGEGCR
jgi:hypothetical protein